MWGNEQVSTYGKSVEGQDQVLGKEPGLGKIKSSKSEGRNFRKESQEQTAEGWRVNKKG